MAEPSDTALLVLLMGYVIGLVCLFGSGFVIVSKAWGLARIERPRWLVSSTARLLIMLFGSGLFLLVWDMAFRIGWMG